MSDPRELSALIGKLFIERRDAKAIQTSSGGYQPVRESCGKPARDHCECDTCKTLIPWKMSDLEDHLAGQRTFGHYLVDPQADTCRVLVFDIDLRSAPNYKLHPDAEPITFDGVEIDPRAVWSEGGNSAVRFDLALQLRAMAEMLARRVKEILDVKALATYSGNKGMHVYGILDPGTAASEARDMARLVIDSLDGDIVPENGHNFFQHAFSFPAIQIETFPKQDSVGANGFGNLVRLPLGVNRKSGKPGMFVEFHTDRTRMTKDDPMIALTQGTIR